MDAKTAFDRVDAAYERLRGDELEREICAVAAQCAAENGAQSPLYASMCSELGGYYRGQARYDESEREFLRAVEILRVDPGEDSPDYTTALNNLAGTYRVMKKYAEAEALFRQCLASYARTLGKNHVLYASGLNNYALLCLDQGDLSRAAELLGESAEVLSALPECRDEYAAALCNRSALLLRLGRAAETVPLLTEAITMFETELGTVTPHYHAALHSLGLAEMAQERYAAAADYFAAAAHAAEELYGEDHPETERILRSFAQARRAMREAQA